MEQQKVEIPRGTFVVILLALMGSLMAVAFLLGRQSAQPVAQATPTGAAAPVMAVASPPVVAVETPQTRPLPIPISRPRPRPRITIQAGDPVAAQPVAQPVAQPAPVAAVEVQVAAVPSAPPARPRPAPAPAQSAAPSYPTGGSVGNPKPAASAPQVSNADKAAIRQYFAQVDAIMADTGALEDPNAFATELLQQSMRGDNSGFESLVKTAQSAQNKMAAIKAPASCKEHHKLMVSQLREATDMLRQVAKATTTGDTSVLSSLALQGKDMKTDIGRLEELDTQLRASAR